MSHVQDLVLGAGLSGRAAARFLLSRGRRVLLSELRSAAALSESDQNEIHGLSQNPAFEVEWGGHERALQLLNASADGDSYLVLSPGIALDHAVVKAYQSALARGLKGEIVNEPELSFRALKRPIIAITGSAGKTTTTTLVGEMLEKSGVSAYVGGNIGRPLVDAVDHQDHYQAIVAELSSFQLEQIRSLIPRVAIFTTLAPDHLDRYPSFDAYVAAKRRLVEACDASSVVIVPRAHAVLSAFGVLGAARGARVAEFFWDGSETFNIGGEPQWEFSLSKLKYRYRHLVENLAAAATAARVLGATREGIQTVVDTFNGLPHRIEWAGEYRGVRFINDSKATNVLSVVSCLQALRESAPEASRARFHLLMGGAFKDLALDALRPALTLGVVSITLFGRSGAELNRRLDDLGVDALRIPVKVVSSMEDALAYSTQIATPGDTVVLSPACTSLDAYRGYADRGEKFKAWVRNWAGIHN